jgi:uncharacterized protein YodC (DUF2158 family)
MVDAEDIVRLKSGGPDMVVEYVFQDDGTREKAAVLRGFAEGDVVAIWQQELPNGSTKTMRETFKAVCLVDAKGKPIVD